MCGRLSLSVPTSALEERFDATAVAEFPPRYNIAPGDELAVIRDDAAAEIRAATWGLLPGWVDDPDDWPHPINARSETVDEKPSFREAYDRRRCLVLADGYYDWRDERGGSQPYRFALEDDAPFAAAGLWERWRSAGDVRTTCTILTTEPSAVVEPIHHRMPVLLAPDEEGTWLRGDETDRRRLLRPYRGDGLRAYPVSSAVNDPRNDRRSLIEPVDVGTQTGLDDFAG